MNKKPRGFREGERDADKRGGPHLGQKAVLHPR
jgi:hypothetical protein